MRPASALTVAAALALAAVPALADPDPADWDAVLAEARGQTVWFNAWGGSAQANDFIAWAGARLAEDFGVTVEHVKLSDTADAVSRVIAERTAGTDAGGAVDLIWINGPNFAAMKDQGLLFGPWAESLPNWALVDPAANAALTADFTVPTEGLEAPWAMAQVVFWHDTARVPDPPRSMPALLAWAEANPGRFTYPQPPDFLGTTFLKQALIGLVPDPSVLQAPAEATEYDAVTAPLWAFLDALTPHLWREGRAYPATGEAVKPLMADGEVDLAISFSPGAASAAIANGELPDTVRSYVLDGGTIGNASFVAIPYNANAKAGAMVLANFLMSPEAQLRMQDPAVLGWGTVLAMDRLAPHEAAAFAALDLGIATLGPADLGTALPEPHPSWMTRIAEDWAARYGAK
jgi:putative thiamine transport system substrate-binding protein